MENKSKAIITGVVLTAIAAGAIISSLNGSVYEYSFDPNLKIWTNIAGDQLDMKKLTCDYAKISDTSRFVRFGLYKENVYVNPNQSIMITVVGSNSETLSAYKLSVDSKNAVSIKEIK